jgi:uncharacterized membrane protein HdeD (DUF308 family)
MTLNAPKAITFWISVILAIVGVVFFFVPAVAVYAIWLLLVGFVLLMLGNIVKGM